MCVGAGMGARSARVKAGAWCPWLDYLARTKQELFKVSQVVWKGMCVCVMVAAQQ